MTASSCDVPLWLIITSNANMAHYFEESDRGEVLEMVRHHEDMVDKIEGIILRNTMKENRRRHLFHYCNQCVSRHRRKVLIEQKKHREVLYARVRLDCQSTLHDDWIKVKHEDMLIDPIENSPYSSIERVISWCR